MHEASRCNRASFLKCGRCPVYSKTVLKPVIRIFPTDFESGEGSTNFLEGSEALVVFLLQATFSPPTGNSSFSNLNEAFTYRRHELLSKSALLARPPRANQASDL